MSLTFTDYPSGLIPAYYDNVVVVQKTDYSSVTMKDYHFVLDVFINGEQATRMNANVIPNSNRGIFYLADILGNYIEPLELDLSLIYVPFTDTYIYSFPEATVKASFNLSDYYNYGGTWVNSGSVITGSTRTVLNSTKWDVLETYNHYGLGAGGTKFLNAKSKYKLNATAPFNWLPLYYFNAVSGAVSKFQIKKYTVAGTLIGTEVFDNPYSNDLTIQQFNSGLVMFSGITNLAYYTIQALDSSDSAITELVRVDIDYSCISDSTVQIYYLTKTGVYNSYLFNGKNITKLKKTTASFQKTIGKLNSGTWIRSTTDNANVVYNTDLSKSIQLNAQVWSDADIDSLSEMIASPIVYILDSSKRQYTGAFEETDFEYKMRRNTKVREYQFTFNYSQPFKMQGQ